MQRYIWTYADVSGFTDEKAGWRRDSGRKDGISYHEKIGLTHHPKRKPNGITKADREAMKSDDLLKRDFRSDEPLKNALRILQRLKQKMESSTLPSYSTASI